LQLEHLRPRRQIPVRFQSTLVELEHQVGPAVAIDVAARGQPSAGLIAGDGCVATVAVSQGQEGGIELDRGIEVVSSEQRDLEQTACAQGERLGS